MTRYLMPLVLIPALAANAAPIDLASRIAPGKWALAYHRTGELRPLHFKHQEQGTSYTCIDGDPRAKIVEWVESKGCTVHSESLKDNVYRMAGECKFKWWGGAPIPVRVELRPQTRKAFTLDIQTEDNAVLGFTEHTKASLQGPCDGAKPATSTRQGKQDQDRQS